MPQLLVGFSAPLHDLRRDGLARHLLLLVGLLLPTVWVRVAAPKPTVACTHLRQRQELVPADAGGEQRAGEQLILAVDALALLRRDPALVDLRPRDLRERAAGEAPGSAAERSAEGAERGGGRTSGCGPRKRASSAIAARRQCVSRERQSGGSRRARRQMRTGGSGGAGGGGGSKPIGTCGSQPSGVRCFERRSRSAASAESPRRRSPARRSSTAAPSGASGAPDARGAPAASAAASIARIRPLRRSSPHR